MLASPLSFLARRGSLKATDNGKAYSEPRGHAGMLLALGQVR